MNNTICKLTLLVLLAAVGGCKSPSASVCDSAQPVPLAPPIGEATSVVDYSDLAAVLHDAFSTDWRHRGVRLLDPIRLARQSARLDAQLARLEIVGPLSTPVFFATAEDSLAYWYNARAAWAIKLAMEAGLPEKLGRSEFEDRPFVLDGRVMTLAGIDNLLAADADWRVLVAAPCVRMNRAPLPDSPYCVADVCSRIDSGLQRFLGDKRRFVIDHEKDRVDVPAVLWRFRERIIQDYHRVYNTNEATFITALLPHASGMTRWRLQSAVGLTCVQASPSDELAVGKP